MPCGDAGLSPPCPAGGFWLREFLFSGRVSTTPSCRDVLLLRMESAVSQMLAGLPCIAPSRESRSGDHQPTLICSLRMIKGAGRAQARPACRSAVQMSCQHNDRWMSCSCWLEFRQVEGRQQWHQSESQCQSWRRTGNYPCVGLSQVVQMARRQHLKVCKPSRFLCGRHVIKEWMVV